MKILANQIPSQRLKILKRHPVNAIHRTGVDGFLDALGAVAILPNRPGTAQIGLHHKGVAGHMGAVAASDTDGLIDPNRPFPQFPTKQRFTAGWLIRTLCGDLKGKRWIGQGVIRQIQASQRVTTSSIEPS